MFEFVVVGDGLLRHGLRIGARAYPDARLINERQGLSQARLGIGARAYPEELSAGTESFSKCI